MQGLSGQPRLQLHARLLIFIYVYVFMCHLCKCLQRPEEDIGYPEAGVANGCELSSVGTGN